MVVGGDDGFAQRAVVYRATSIVKVVASVDDQRGIRGLRALKLEGADVACAALGPGQAALVDGERGTGRRARIDGWAARKQGMGQRFAAIASEMPEAGVLANHIAVLVTNESATVELFDEVVAKRRERAQAVWPSPAGIVANEGVAKQDAATLVRDSTSRCGVVSRDGHARQRQCAGVEDAASGVRQVAR